MAGGFWRGLAGGALTGAVLLAGLSLTAPLPRGASGAVDVGLPVGSEFGRGGDVAPRLPAPNAASPRPATDPVAVPLPADEPAPATATQQNARPEALAVDRLPGQPKPAADGASPALRLPDAGRDAAPAADRAAPLPPADADASPRLAPDAPDAGAAPALPAPALDLSLPPDLTDLRRLERN